MFRRRSEGRLAEIKFLGYLSDLVGKRKEKVELGSPVPLRELLPDVFPQENIIVLVDEKPGDLDTPVTPESTVVLMPMLSGG